MTAEITALLEPDRPWTADEAAAVAWWQNLSDEARLAALKATKDVHGLGGVGSAQASRRFGSLIVRRGADS